MSRDPVEAILEEALAASASGKGGREHVSPEGVEELVLLRYEFFLTQTQGGKFRAYIAGTKGEATPLRVTDSLFAGCELLAETKMLSAVILQATAASLKKKRDKKDPS